MDLQKLSFVDVDLQSEWIWCFLGVAVFKHSLINFKTNGYNAIIKPIYFRAQPLSPTLGEGAEMVTV